MTSRTPAVALAALTLSTLALAACSSSASTPTKGSPNAGGDDQPVTQAGASPHTASSACDLTTQTVVASVFPGASPGRPGRARDCVYSLPSGDVGKVNVFFYGSDSIWNEQKAAARKYTGAIPVDVRGADDAYVPKGPVITVTARANGVSYGVQVLPRTITGTTFYLDHKDDIVELASKIASSH